MEATLDSIFQGQIETGKIAGVAALAYNRSGDILFGKGYGNTRIGEQDSPKVTIDSPGPLFSCTKLIVSIAALQLIEQGRLSLTDHAAKYLPEIDNIPVLDGFDENDEPRLLSQTNKITILHLMTHTAGFTYDFFDKNTLKSFFATNRLPGSTATVGTKDLFEGPLAFQPGTNYSYGVNTDWLGWIIAKISGMDLKDYVGKHISAPLGLKITKSSLSEEADKNRMNIHLRQDDGSLAPTQVKHVEDPPAGTCGGHYLYSTASEFCQILLTVLNEGTHPVTGVTLLKPETVKDYLFTDMLPGLGVHPQNVGMIPSAIPQLTCEGEFLPGIKKGWSCGMMLTLEDTPNGRSKGSGSWAGLGNCYYFIDPKIGVLAFIGSASFPFFDKHVLHLTDALERALYGKPMAKSIGEDGSNFRGGELIVALG